MTRKILFSFIFLLMPFITAMAAVGDTFQIETNGIKVYFTVISSDECQLGKQIDTDNFDYTSTALDNDGSSYSTSSIFIPETVNYQNKDYTVTEVGAGAFMSAEIKSIKLPKTITKIDWGAFYQASIETINIPESFKSFYHGDYNGLGECYPFTESYIDDVTIECDEKYTKDLFTDATSIKNKHNGRSDDPTKITDHKYDGSKELTGTYTIQDGITTIGVAAFQNCVNITEVIIPASVTSIGASAFSGCTSLEKVTIADGSKLTSLGASAFEGCAKLSSIIIPEGITKINNSLFNGCSNLSNITFKGTITSIGNNAFQSCTKITSLKDLNSVTSMGDYAFAGTGLTKFDEIDLTKISLGKCVFANLPVETLTIPDAWTTIPGEGTFSGSTTLTKIEGGKNLTSIPNTTPKNKDTLNPGTFSGCTKLSDISALSKVKSIGSGAFLGCRSITDINFFTNVETIGAGAFEGTGIKSVKLNSVKKLEGYSWNGVFRGCSQLSDVDLSGSPLEELGTCSFWECKALKTVKLPATLTSIGQRAFGRCGNKESTILEYIDISPATGITSGLDLDRTQMFGTFGDEMSKYTVIYLPKGYFATTAVPNYVTSDADGSNAVCDNFLAIYSRTFTNTNEYGHVISSTDEPATTLPYGFTAKKFTLDGRTFTEGANTTLSLPYTLTDTKSASGKIYELASLDPATGKAVFKEVKKTVAGKAYIFAPSASQFTAENVIVKGFEDADASSAAKANLLAKAPADETATDEPSATTDDTTAPELRGVAVKTTLTGDYYVFDGTKFVKKTNPTIDATEAYLYIDPNTTAPDNIDVTLEDTPDEVNPEGTVITLAADQWSTFTSSIDVDLTSWNNSSVKAYYASSIGVDGGNPVVNLIGISNGVKTGTGIVLHNEGAEATITVKGNPSLTDNFRGNMLVGTLQNVQINYTESQDNATKYNYYLSTAGEFDTEYKFFRLPDDGLTIPAGKAYLQLSDEDHAKLSNGTSSSQAKPLFIIADGKYTTGISEVKNDEDAVKNQNVYDLSGRLVGTSLKGLKAGLYIQGGKKVILK